MTSELTSDDQDPKSRELDRLLAEIEHPELALVHAREDFPDAPPCFMNRHERLFRSVDDHPSCRRCKALNRCHEEAQHLIERRVTHRICFGSAEFGTLDLCRNCELVSDCRTANEARAASRGCAPAPDDQPREVAAMKTVTGAGTTVVSPIAAEPQVPIVHPTSLAPSRTDERPPEATRAPQAAESTYRFPDRRQLADEVARLRALPTDQVLEELRALVDAVGATNPVGYMNHRARTCAIGWVLNSRRAIPPFLRPGFRARKVGTGATYGSDASTLANDLRVLDAHWLHCTDRLRARHLMRSDGGLDVAKTSAWASRKMNGIKRASDLDLSDAEAREMMICRPTAITDQQRRIRAALDAAPTRIRSALAKPTNRRSDPPGELLGVAQALLLTENDHHLASAMLPMLGVATLSPRQVSERKNWLTANGVIPR